MGQISFLLVICSASDQQPNFPTSATASFGLCVPLSKNGFGKGGVTVENGNMEA